MDYLKLVKTMTPDVYQRLARAVAVGKWPDGTVLTTEQRHDALQAVIAWGELHLPASERVGFIDKGRKAGGSCDEPRETRLKWAEESHD
jgi:uncharacterized protein